MGASRPPASACAVWTLKRGCASDACGPSTRSRAGSTCPTRTGGRCFRSWRCGDELLRVRPRSMREEAAMASADWYFDFVSPFAYLQCEQLVALETKINIRYRPILFAGLLKAHGHRGPAEIATKRLFTYRFVVWQARQLGIAFKFPPVHPFNPLPLLRMAVAADGDRDVVRTIFRFVWRDGRLGDLPIEWAELMAMLGPCAAANVPELEARA